MSYWNLGKEWSLPFALVFVEKLEYNEKDLSNLICFFWWSLSRSNDPFDREFLFAFWLPIQIFSTFAKVWI